MKIIGDNQYLKLDAYLKTRPLRPSKDEGSERPPEVSGEGDTVSLSGKAQDLYEARRIMGEIPDVRAEKVARLRKEIEDGTYRVEGRDIAKKMIEEALEYERILKSS
jgi:flagellar biosynthesis anti-sigma factor FlgM